MRVGGLFLMKNNRASINSLRCMATAAVAAPPATPRAGENFEAKNLRLKRPLSPHLTIYKPQLTSMLSITHRGTGVALSVMLSGFGFGTWMLNGSYPYYLNQLASMELGFAVIYAAKFAIAFPFLFHTFNGVRHLVWDMGYGFSLRSLYKSGYGVVALTVVTSAIAAYL